jgi:hypothetical protein
MKSIELVNLTAKNTKEELGSVFVDPVTNGASASSASRFSFSEDSINLFNDKDSNTGSELITFSVSPFQVVTRSIVGDHPAAFAVVPGKQWILLATGPTGNEKLEAIDIKNHNVIYTTTLPENPATPTTKISTGCVGATS